MIPLGSISVAAKFFIVSVVVGLCCYRVRGTVLSGKKIKSAFFLYLVKERA